MQFRILGPLEVHGRDAELVHLGSAKLRAVLAVLLVNANRPVSSGRLIDLVWPDQPPPSAVGAIRTYISSLRRILRPGGNLVTESAGYRMRVAPGDLDLLAFEDLTAQGERALQAGDPATAADRLRRGLDLWRGPPLEDVPVDPDMDGRLAGLEERRLTAAESLIQARLDLGEHTELIAELRELVHERPLRERLWEQWMLALYRVGRQADALAAFRTLRSHLAGELGVEPGHGVRDLHQLILRGDPRLDLPPGGPRPPARPRQLPPDIAGFTGRTAEIDRLLILLGSDSRTGPPSVAAIDGVGGIGKSALAIHVGHLVAARFPDGQLYADLLGAARDSTPVPPLDVLGQFLRALGVPGSERWDVAEAAARFRAETATRRLLVVLDNAADAAQVHQLMPSGPGCGVLLTSRGVLSTVDGAGYVHLGVLSTGETVSLLSRLAGSDRIAAESAAATRIAQLCGHLPLAVRIAGARLAARPAWPVRELANRLGDARCRLDELRVADLDIRAVLRVSHDALVRGDRDDQAAAQAFALLGQPDWPDLPLSVVTRLGVSEQVVERLVDAQLLESRAPGRYRFHDLLRLLARELAPADVDSLTIAMRWQVATTWQAFGVLRPGDGRLTTAASWADGGSRFESADAALDWLEDERANLVATVLQAAATPGIPAEIPGQLARALFAFFHIRKHWADWVRVNEIVLSAARRSGDRFSEAFAHRDLGAVFEMQGRFDRALDHLRAGRQLFEALGDRNGEAACLNGLGAVHNSVGRFDAAARCIERGLAIARNLGDRHCQALYLNNLGAVYVQWGDWGRALQRLTEARAILTELGNLRSLAACLNHLGEVYQARGALDEALASHSEALATFDELADEVGSADCLVNLGRTHRRLGQHEKAVECLRRGVSICERTDDRRGKADGLRQLADTLAAAGRHSEAVELWRRALPILADLGVPAASEVRATLAEADGGDIAASGVTVGSGEDHAVRDHRS